MGASSKFFKALMSGGRRGGGERSNPEKAGSDKTISESAPSERSHQSDKDDSVRQQTVSQQSSLYYSLVCPSLFCLRYLAQAGRFFVGGREGCGRWVLKREREREMHFVSISLLSWVAEEDEPWKITREGTQEMDIVEAAWGDRQQQQQQQRAAAAWSSWRRPVHHKLQSGIQAGATTTDAGRTLHRLERCVFFHFFPCACGCCRLGCCSHSNCLSSILGQKFSFSLSQISLALWDLFAWWWEEHHAASLFF